MKKGTAMNGGGGVAMISKSGPEKVSLLVGPGEKKNRGLKGTAMNGGGGLAR